MPVNPRDRIITPATDSGRFSAEEAALHAAGRCCHQAGFGLPWTEYCESLSQPGAPFGYCEEHATDLLAGHWPDGTPRSAINPRYQDEPGYPARHAALEAHHRACTPAAPAARTTPADPSTARPGTSPHRKGTRAHDH